MSFILKRFRIHRTYAVSRLLPGIHGRLFALSTAVYSMVTKIEMFTLYLRTLCFPKRVHAVEFGACDSSPSTCDFYMSKAKL
jgi:hypothetical protein